MTGACAVYALSAPGLELALRLAPALGAQVFAPARLAGAGVTPFETLSDLMPRTFSGYARHVFVGAAGIAVRAIAPHLKGKGVDPAVVVLDQGARFAVSLVSGHVGGANALARELSALTGAQAVITTGTDVAGLPGVDELAARSGMAVANAQAVKAVSAALIEGRPVQVYDPEGRLLPGLEQGEDAGGLLVPTEPRRWNPDAPGVWCCWRTGGEHPATFRAYPRCLSLGLGSRKGTPARAIRAHVATVLAQSGLDARSIARVGTAEIKRDDPGMCEALESFGAEVVFFTADELAAVAAAGQSETVRRQVGTGSVCEAAALLLARSGESADQLIVPKVKGERVTCAVALAKSEGA